MTPSVPSVGLSPASGDTCRQEGRCIGMLWADEWPGKSRPTLAMDTDEIIFLWRAEADACTWCPEGILGPLCDLCDFTNMLPQSAVTSHANSKCS